MVEKSIDISELNPDEREMLLLMGVGNNEPDPLTAQLLAEIKAELMAIAKPKYCYTIVERIDFHYGHIIAEALAQGDRYAIVVSTAGAEVDAYLRAAKESDIVRAFVADAIASEMAEATQRFALRDIESTLATNEKMSNPYSPGYCGWVLREQRKLFAIFDKAPCGITLNDSCLMTPVKSISSVVAIGTNVEKAPYGCQICEKVDCYKNQSKFRHKSN